MELSIEPIGDVKNRRLSAVFPTRDVQTLSRLTYIRKLVLSRLSGDGKVRSRGPIEPPDTDLLGTNEWRRLHQMAAHRRRQMLTKTLLEESDRTGKDQRERSARVGGSNE